MRKPIPHVRLVFVLLGAILSAPRQTHAAEKEIEKGATVKVVNGPAPVKVGKKTLTTVETGMELTALKIQGPWVKVSVRRDGKKITGWIYSKKYLARIAGPEASKPDEPKAAKPEKAVKPEQRPDFAQSDQLDKLLLSAVVKVWQTPGRSYGFLRMYVYDAAGRATTILSVNADWSHLPEKIVIPSEGSPCPATLGWEWELTVREVVGGQVSLRSPPSGSIIRLGGPLRLGKSQLPSGTILMRSETGWSVVSPDEAAARMEALLAVKYTKDYVKDDLRVVGALGAAVLGPSAKDLAPALKAVAKSNPEHRLAGFCAKALARIGDRSALPEMRQMRDRAGTKRGIVEVIDAAIAEFER